MNYDDLLQQTIAAGNEGGLGAAINYINNFINENPNFIEAYLIRGEIYKEMENFQEALNDFEEVISTDPNIAKSYFLRGLLYTQSGSDVSKALNDFSKAIELDVNYTAAYVNRGNMYLKLGKFQQAISDCTKAIEISPNKNAEPYYNRGLAYVNIGETAKALDDYNKVIDLVPKNAEAYAKRGTINLELGNTKEAIYDFEKFLELDPNNKNAKLVKDELEQLKNGTSPSSAESYEVVTAKKERKILLIWSVIGFILGTIIGASSGSVLLGMWFGIGIGGALTFLPEIPRIFMVGFRRDGFIEAIKTTVFGGAIWLLIFILAGPIGLLVRVLKKNNQIKKFQGNV